METINAAFLAGFEPSKEGLSFEELEIEATEFLTNKELRS